MSTVERLAALGHPVYALDISTDEAVRVGFHVVRVVIPSLQPFSYVYHAQYKAHRRLYEAPRAMGYTVHAEADLNPHPIPFA